MKYNISFLFLALMVPYSFVTFSMKDNSKKEIYYIPLDSKVESIIIK